jgi:hypothetical protein
MGAVVVGHATRFGAGDATTSDEEYEFLSCDLGLDGSHREPEGMRGNRSLREEPVVEGTDAVNGTVVIEPRPDDLDNWLPRILGSGGAVAATVPTFVCNVARVAENNLYVDCKIDRAVFSASSTQNLQLSMDIVGTTESSQAFPDIAASLSTLQPYVLHQAVLTINSVTYACDNLEIVIANQLLQDRFYNSQTRSEIPEGSRLVTVSCDQPFNADDTALYDIARAGLAGSVVYTNGAYSIDFSFANLKMPRSRQAIGGRNIALDKRLELTAYATPSTAEIVVTNDSTP